MPVPNGLNHCSVTAARAAQTKACHNVWVGNKCISNSSNANITPPKGAPKATETPAAAAAA